MEDLNKAKILLPSHTCVLCKGEQVYTSNKPGISPMLDWLDDGVKLQGFSAADKIVGKAAALLFVLSGIRAVHAQVLSTPGKAVLQQHGIFCTLDTEAAYIINRTGDGPCPMEQTVEHIVDPATAFEALKATRARLIKNNNDSQN